MTQKFYRAIFECSSLANNDEFVVHTLERIPFLHEIAEELNLGENPPYHEYNRAYQDYLYKHCGFQFNGPSLEGRWPELVMSRELSLAEVKEGCDPMYSGPRRKQKVPEVTRMLDELTKMLHSIKTKLEFRPNLSPEWCLRQFVAYSYYDCMSEGCSQYALAMARELVERYKLDLNAQVYPASREHEEETGRDWYTWADFLKDIEDIPRFDFQKLLPAGTFALLSESTP